VEVLEVLVLPARQEEMVPLEALEEEAGKLAMVQVTEAPVLQDRETPVEGAGITVLEVEEVKAQAGVLTILLGAPRQHTLVEATQAEEVEEHTMQVVERVLVEVAVLAQVELCIAQGLVLLLIQVQAEEVAVGLVEGTSQVLGGLVLLRLNISSNHRRNYGTFCKIR